MVGSAHHQSDVTPSLANDADAMEEENLKDILKTEILGTMVAGKMVYTNI